MMTVLFLVVNYPFKLLSFISFKVAEINLMNISNEHLMRMNENELYWPGMFTHTRNLL